MKFKVGPDSVKNYRRLNYTHWHALAEFVDNSTQSYMNNVDLLEPLRNGEIPLKVDIVYDGANHTLRIFDNSIGMNEEDLERAMQLGLPPENPNSRSQFGLGMKTAAFWLGDELNIRTKKFGDKIEYEINLEIDKIASGNVDLDIKKVEKKIEDHYTYIEVRKLHDTIKGMRLGKIRRFLASMYRVDIREQRLLLSFQNEILNYDDNHTWAVFTNGEKAFKELNFEIAGKKVSGFVGVLEEGSRSLAGFSLLRYGRVIRGHPDAYRPELIFGQFLGSNNLINQRLAGEIHLDAFMVSHTKDNIQFTDQEEADFQEKLLSESTDLKDFARDRRKDKSSKGPSDSEKQVAINKVAHEVNSPELVDNIELTQEVPEAVLEAAQKPLIESATQSAPSFTAQVGATKLLVYISKELSHFEPYYASEQAKTDLIVIINDNHPIISSISDSEGYANYIRYCIYDALAERKGLQAHKFTPMYLKLMKDQLLRVPAILDEYSDD